MNPQQQFVLGSFRSQLSGLSPVERKEVLQAFFAETQGPLSATAGRQERLLQRVPEIVSALRTKREEIADSRNPSQALSIIRFELPLLAGQSIPAVLEELRGAQGRQALLESWATNIDSRRDNALSGQAKELNQVVLLIDSHTRSVADREQDLQAIGLAPADPDDSALICAVILCKMNLAGIKHSDLLPPWAEPPAYISERFGVNEFQLASRLKRGVGFIEKAVIGMSGDGNIRANIQGPFILHPEGSAECFALGKPLG